MHKTKLFGALLGAALALGALGASSATAFFDSETESTTIKGEQPAGAPHEFTVEAGSWSCEVAKFHSLAKATETGTIKGVKGNRKVHHFREPKSAPLNEGRSGGVA